MYKSKYYFDSVVWQEIISPAFFQKNADITWELRKIDEFSPKPGEGRNFDQHNEHLRFLFNSRFIFEPERSKKYRIQPQTSFKPNQSHKYDVSEQSRLHRVLEELHSLNRNLSNALDKM